ncbi:hypothetical protein K491DRAFT_291566 [Lophiostoma macrostomum CBS 122681]|uniref:Uncharacterized protein n=1 Tax=Lophiostoma macrostomum CBS 122681 TaxID=1314788 RepID=A0A6A6SJH4_9PLEO|nr:hypothetical protein K491DRAFT_291566 [Lophiostoma macrostomum CBS 122681]
MHPASDTCWSHHMRDYNNILYLEVTRSRRNRKPCTGEVSMHGAGVGKVRNPGSRYVHLAARILGAALRASPRATLCTPNDLIEVSHAYLYTQRTYDAQVASNTGHPKLNTSSMHCVAHLTDLQRMRRHGLSVRALHDQRSQLKHPPGLTGSKAPDSDPTIEFEGRRMVSPTILETRSLRLGAH